MTHGRHDDDEIGDCPDEQDADLFADDDSTDDDLDTVPCPACGKHVLAEAHRCHNCGEYFGREAWLVQPSRKQAIWAVAATLVIAAMLWFVMAVVF